MVAEAAPEASVEAPGQELTLPAHLTVELSLTTPVQSDLNRVGDGVEAIVDREVKRNGQVWLPRGARMTGRVRRLEHYSTPYEYWVAALEFTDVACVQDGISRHARFTGSMQFYDSLPGLKQDIATERTTENDLGGLGSVQNIHQEKLIARQLPG